MNGGYVATVLVVTVGLLLSAVPMRRPRVLGVVTWFLSDLVNESPFFAFGYLLMCSVPVLVSRDESGVVWFALGCAAFVVSPVLLGRARQARPVLRAALDRDLGPGVAEPQGWRTGLPWARIIAAPVPVFPLGIRRRRGLAYGPDRRNRLDVYTGTTSVTGRPVLVHLHGGGFRSGRKSLYARPLLHAFAKHGWVCISASYRLRPASYDDMLADVRSVVGWAREHSQEMGADPARVVLVGSSAGAHLALTAALTSHRHQGGSSGANCRVAAVVGLYGYYGRADRSGPPSQPIAYVHPQAPPVLIVHAAQDTLLPPGLQKELVAALRASSTSPVVYAELPGAQHTFDLLHSVRFEHVIDAIASFTAAVLPRSPALQTRPLIPGPPPMRSASTSEREHE